MTSPRKIAELRWHCRRGMRELDILLGRWLDERYAGATPDEQLGFERLLETPDPQLYGWLMGRDRPPDALLNTVVDAIRGL